jgi:hypothetical protein
VPAFGHEHRHLRLDAARDADHLVGRRHFQVQLDMRELAQAPDVLVLDVAPVFAQVHGDAVGAAEMRFDRGPDGVGLVRTPRLPHRGHMVDVDPQFDHESITGR